MFFKGLIELAACSSLPEGHGKEDFAYWKFLKKYENKIPFKAEQVLNPALAELYRRRKWTEYQVGGIPQFFSPLAMEMFHDHKYMKMTLGESFGLRKWIDLCEGILDDVHFSLEKSEISSGWCVTGKLNGDTVCVASFKRGKNNYTRGYRIGNYSVFDWHKRQGLGSAMIDFFERETGFKVIPSQLFGAGGQLTKDGHRAAIARLKRNNPEWLPSNWEELVEPPKL